MDKEDLIENHRRKKKYEQRNSEKWMQKTEKKEKTKEHIVSVMSKINSMNAQQLIEFIKSDLQNYLNTDSKPIIIKGIHGKLGKLIDNIKLYSFQSVNKLYRKYNHKITEKDYCNIVLREPPYYDEESWEIRSSYHRSLYHADKTTYGYKIIYQKNKEVLRIYIWDQLPELNSIQQGNCEEYIKILNQVKIEQERTRNFALLDKK